MNADQKPELAKEEKVIRVKSRTPTEKDLFYLDWGKELLKNQFTLTNELLKQIISLCVALLSVSVIFDKLFEADVHLKFFAVLFFLLALIAAYIGINPFSKGIWLNSPSEIEKFQKQAINYKKICYGLANVFLLFGVGVILIAVVKQVYLQ